jgi:cytochrome b561
LAANRALHEQMEGVHLVAAHLTFGLVILHGLGALKHLLIDRDGTVARMIVPRR